MKTIIYGIKKLKKLIIILPVIITPSFSAVISIKQSATEVIIGNQLSVDILVTDLGVNQIPGAFDFNLLYNPSILQFKEYDLTNESGSISENSILDLSEGLLNPGEVNISGLSFDDNSENALNTFRLASVIFNAIGEGITVLDFSNVTLGDYFGDEISTAIQSSSVQSVPESSSMALMSIGLFSLAGLFMFRKKNC